jgi:hypothetical protein
MSGTINKTSSRLVRGLLCLAGLVACVGTTGCQVDVAGQTLPSPNYMSDDIQYFPPGPEFKLSREAAAMQAYSAQQSQPPR